MAISHPARTALVAALLISVSLPALADPDEGGFYLRAFGGVSSLSDSDLSGAVTGTSGFDSGQMVGGAVGYKYAASPFRSEIEYAYRSGEADGSAGVTGDLASTSLALNGYYDFTPVSGGRVTPYVGAGIAYVTEVDFDVIGGSAAGEYSDRGGIGFQVMAGVDYALSDRWSINGELRYFDAGRQDLTGAGGTLSTDYQTFDLIVGTSFNF